MALFEFMPAAFKYNPAGGYAKMGLAGGMVIIAGTLIILILLGLEAAGDCTR